jgi:hypothetical protein
MGVALVSTETYFLPEVSVAKHCVNPAFAADHTKGLEATLQYVNLMLATMLRLTVGDAWGIAYLLRGDRNM